MTEFDMGDAEEERPEILAKLGTSGPRRVIGAAILGALGVLLIYLGLVYPPASILWRVFLLAFGGFVLYGTKRFWHDTTAILELTKTELRQVSVDGQVMLLTRIDNIRDVSRGALAIKPSNGFSLSLYKSGPRAWAPGLWWRLGRKIGVGGVTSSPDSRYMAEMIASLVPKT